MDPRAAAANGRAEAQVVEVVVMAYWSAVFQAFVCGSSFASFIISAAQHNQLGAVLSLVAFVLNLAIVIAEAP